MKVAYEHGLLRLYKEGKLIDYLMRRASVLIFIFSARFQQQSTFRGDKLHPMCTHLMQTCASNFVARFFYLSNQSIS